MASDDHDFQDVWDSAVRKYEEQTESRLRDRAMFQKIRTLDDFSRHVDAREQNFIEYREKHRKVYSKMLNCFKPIVPLLNLGKAAIGSSPYAPAGIAFAAAASLLEACEKVTKCYDAVEEVFAEISNLTVRLKEYTHGTIDASLKATMTKMLAYVLDIIGQVEKLVQRRRIKQWWRSVLMEHNDVSSRLDKLRRHAEEELGLVVALTYAKVGDLQSTTEEMRANVGEILKNQQRERFRAFSEDDEKRITEALKTDATHAILDKYTNKREILTKGTGTWIKDNPDFQKWEQEQAPILWIFGQPGMGDTNYRDF